MENSERTGRHGKGINTGKSMAEESGMERSGSMMRVMAEAEEDTAIRLRRKAG
jgi:hypothetical protein